MKTKSRVVMGLVGVVILGAVGFWVWAYLRPSDRVTLDVRNVEVREVARKIERQTGRTIVVQSNVVGKVTLKAKNVPFEKALTIVSEQVSARVGSIYPLYSNGKSLDRLKAILAGQTDSRIGWTNLAGAGMRMGGPGSRREEMPKTNGVSLNIAFEDLAFAALAFSRLTPARMVVEDGASKRISVSLTNAPVREAVALVAKKADKDWTEIFVLSGGGFGPGRGPEGLARRRVDAAESTDEERAEREVLNDHLLATLPEEERQKREEAAAERQKQMEEFQSMTAEQRMQAMQMMRQNQPQGGSQRMLERIKNSTPEQRAAQRRQMAQRRADPNRVPPVTRN